MKESVITINGRRYNAVTGQPIVGDQAVTAPREQRTYTDVALPKKTIASKPSHAVHQTTQKSQTLLRKALKKPEPVVHPAATPTHPMVSKFSAHATPLPVEPHTEVAAPTPIAPAQTHPVVARALRAPHQPVPERQLSGTELKEKLIKERLAEVSNSHKKAKTRKLLVRPRMATMLTASLAFLILGGYLAYINLPVVSMRVAASKAGIAAVMPNYKPEGYSLNGPISYSPGEVVIRYQSGKNTTAYQVIEHASNWDSQALLDNYVAKNTNNYQTILDRGLTIYTFNGKAAWVTGGLLYTIDGNAHLTTEQVLKIAASI